MKATRASHLMAAALAQYRVEHSASQRVPIKTQIGRVRHRCACQPATRSTVKGRRKNRRRSPAMAVSLAHRYARRRS